jgi:Type I phosphodiesterase / nucleotide pyrophosphatase
MMKKSHFAALASLLASTLVACGGDDTGTTSMTGGGNTVGGAGSNQTTGTSGGQNGGNTGTAGDMSGSGGMSGVGGMNIAGAAGAVGGSGGSGPMLDGGANTGATAVIFFIDGLTPQAVDTALGAGMVPNIKFLLDNGVRVQLSHPATPTARVVLPDGSMPNGGSTAGNRVPHTGTHLIEANHDGLDDIFKEATAAGLKSLLVADDPNYSAFTTPTVHEIITTAPGAATDDQVISRFVTLYQMNKPRLIRIHLQHIRTAWVGPDGLTTASSPYIQYLIADDKRLGTFIQALKDGGVWDNTYFVLGSDHGMGVTLASAHPANERPSWNNFMAFYGPGLKKGATIPYAENPDIPVTLVKLLGLPPLKGHTAANVTIAVKGPTGQYLSNLLAGAPADLTPPHPKYMEQFLMTTPALEDNYAQYRDGMIRLIK